MGDDTDARSTLAVDGAAPPGAEENAPAMDPDVVAAALAAEAAEAEMEGARALAASQQLAAQAAEALEAAERASREAAEAEERAMRQAEELFPTISAVEARRRRDDELERARAKDRPERVARDDGARAGGRTSASRGGGWADEVEAEGDHFRRVLGISDSDGGGSGNWRRRDAGGPADADGGSNGVGSDWRRREETSAPQPAAPFVAAPRPDRSAWRGSPAASSQYPVATPACDDGGSARHSLLQIQRQQEGAGLAREKLEQLTQQGFPAAPAADMLLQMEGDVRAAALALHRAGYSRPAEPPSPPEERVTNATTWMPTGKPQVLLRKGAPPSPPAAPSGTVTVVTPSGVRVVGGGGAGGKGGPPPMQLTPPKVQPSYPLEPRSPPLPPQSCPLPPAAGAVAGSPPSGGGGSLSMADKLSLIKSELMMAPSLPMAAAVKAANAQMGLGAEGPLPAQVERLLKALGLPRKAA